MRAHGSQCFSDKINNWHPLQLKKNQCCLAGSSKTAPRIFIFSIVLGAEYLSYVKSIKTHARAFLPLNISAVGSVKTQKTRVHSRK